MPQMLAKRLPEAEAKPETLLESLKAGPSCSPLACRAGAQIGPNSLTQIAAALEAFVGAEETARIFAETDLTHRLVAPPESLVPEREAIRLHGHLRHALDARGARVVARDAGQRTADYLLAHRIPKSAQLLLRLLPARLASHLLVDAITRNAWTFAGGGRFFGRGGRPTLLSLVDGPLAWNVEADHAVCDYYAATFERLFRKLVSPDAYCIETTCQACGADVCRFEIRF